MEDDPYCEGIYVEVRHRGHLTVAKALVQKVTPKYVHVQHPLWNGETRAYYREGLTSTPVHAGTETTIAPWRGETADIDRWCALETDLSLDTRKPVPILPGHVRALRSLYRVAAALRRNDRGDEAKLQEIAQQLDAYAFHLECESE